MGSKKIRSSESGAGSNMSVRYGISKDEALSLIKEAARCPDLHMAHAAADIALCEFLVSLGHIDLVCQYSKVPNPYSVLERSVV